MAADISDAANAGPPASMASGAGSPGLRFLARWSFLGLACLGLVGFVWPFPPLWLLDALLIAPVLAFPLGYAGTSNSNRRRKAAQFFLLFAMMACGPALAVQASREIDTVDYLVPLTVAAIFGAPAALLAYRTFRSNRSGLLVAVGVGLSAGAYASGAFCLLNRQLDFSSPVEFRTEALTKHISGSRLFTWKVDVAKTPSVTPYQITVSPTAYERLVVGKQACLAVHPGLFHSRWIELDTCR